MPRPDSPEELVIGHGNPGGLFFGGPAVVLILLATLASFALLSVSLGRAETLARLGERAASRLDQGRAIPTLWGVAATVFLLALAAVLFSTKVLALLGVLALAVCLGLAGLGLGVAALGLGQRIHDACGSLTSEPHDGLRLGLWALLLASILPFVGWLLVGLALAAGIGAVLELLVSRRSASE